MVPLNQQPTDNLPSRTGEIRLPSDGRELGSFLESLVPQLRSLAEQGKVESEMLEAAASSLSGLAEYFKLKAGCAVPNPPEELSPNPLTALAQLRSFYSSSTFENLIAWTNKYLEELSERCPALRKGRRPKGRTPERYLDILGDHSTCRQLLKELRQWAKALGQDITYTGKRVYAVYCGRKFHVRDPSTGNSITALNSFPRLQLSRKSVK